MQLPLILAIILPFFQAVDQPRMIQSVPVPPGFSRVQPRQGSFADFIHKLELRENKTIYYYNGQPKPNQQACYAVLTIPVRNNPTLQCADAVLLIRATWLFEQKNYNEIRFLATDGSWLIYSDWCKGVRYQLRGNRLLTVRDGGKISAPGKRENLDAFLQLVYAYCGTASLSKQLKKKASSRSPEPGDVFLQPGHPGHVMLVADLAKNAKGETVFLLLQGFMPAQDIHLTKSLQTKYPQPWQGYTGGRLETLEWSFPPGSLYQW